MKLVIDPRMTDRLIQAGWKVKDGDEVDLGSLDAREACILLEELLGFFSPQAAARVAQDWLDHYGVPDEKHLQELFDRADREGIETLSDSEQDELSEWIR